MNSRENCNCCFSVSITFATDPNEMGKAKPAREVGACPENAISNQRRFTQRMIRNRWARGRVRALMSSEEAKNKDGREAFGNEPVSVAQTSPSFLAASCHSEEWRKMKVDTGSNGSS